MRARHPLPTSAVRRVAALAVTTLLAAVLAPLGLPARADADTSGGVPGVPRADASTLSVGVDFGCAIVADGSVRCWGGNGEGQLAQGNTASIGDNPGESTVRVDLGPGRTAVAVTAGSFHACAILDTGQLRCWGYNSDGQLGQGNTTKIGDSPGETTVAVDLGAGRTAVSLEAGDYHTCAVLDTGQLRCWGHNGVGQLGQGNTTNIGDTAGETTVAVDLGVGRTAVAVAAGFGQTCAVLDTGQLRCWGRNDLGQLGQGSTAYVGDNPGESTVAVDLGPGRTAIAVASGEYHTCAVLDTGQLRCWGWNGAGQLGQGSAAVSYGTNPGETPAALPAINLGGQQVGRDTDGDGIRDAVDACPTVPGALPNGCAAAAAAAPEAVLKGRKVLLDTVLAKKHAAAPCPAKAEVVVKTRSSKGRLTVAKQLRTKQVPGGCRVKGKIRLPLKPKKTAKVKVTVSGKKLAGKRLVAVRL